MSFKLNRRELIQKAIASFGVLSVPVTLTACGDDKDTSLLPSINAEFLHGVASGDPLQDRIILWTRLSPSDLSARLEVSWEIATDASFTQVAQRGKVQTSAAQDFTVKVDANQLKPNQRYYYRFKFGSKTSPVGQCKTLAETTQDVRFAVCSCSNYPAGYFHVYKEIAKQDLDVVIHLGDYIYEYGAGEYASEDAEKLGRTLAENNNKELLKLDDYRRRYALYRTDPDLQAAHQLHPFIVIWDDHELANDTWKDGAENHQNNEGAFIDRKLAALQAYFEWMPIRPVAENNHLNIYRQFNFGQLVQLNMLDTRILARDRQLNYKNYLTAEGLDAEKFQRDLTDTKRTLLGYAQRDWLLDQISTSKAHWQVIGQQVLMSKMLIPAELLMSLAQILEGQASEEVLAKLFAQVSELVVLKMRAQAGDPTLTEPEKARLSQVVPYNLDAWDGYYYERELIYARLKALNKKAVILAGDTHNAWQSTLQTQDQSKVAVELACSSVSSPGMEQYLKIPAEQLAQVEMAFKTLIDELNYCNLNQRGYMVLHFTEHKLQSSWHYVDTVKDKEYQVLTEREYTIAFDTTLKTLNEQP